MSDRETKAQISFQLNGTSVSVRVPARLNLVDLLRTEFRLTGSHVGCEHGVCGACNVMLDGVVVRGCLTLAIQADGRDVVSIEGLTANGQIRDLQEIFVRRNALQCGFCTPGMLLTAAELLARERTPSREQIRDEISGNYCRCTGYQAIVDAIEDVVARRNGRDAPEPLTETRALIGASRPRQNAARLTEGRGTYTDDIALPNMAHVFFLRSPHAHARIVSIDVGAARAAPGVIAIFTGADLAAVCPAWQTRLAMMPSHHSPPQPPIAIDEVGWQGEAVAAIVAATRREAEDAAELIEVQWEDLPAVATLSEALAPDAPLVHTAMTSNLAIDHRIESGDIAKHFSEAAAIVEHSFRFERQTAVSLEPRGIVASFDRNLGELTIYQSHQAPFQMREVFAEQLGLSPESVRVVVKDVGGGFGLKLHAFADEMAVAAIATLLPVPVKFTADRLEAFVSDAHTREADVHGRMALDATGKILGFEIDMLAGFGAYSIYPRSSVGEVIQTLQMVGAPYEIGAYQGRGRGVFLNKPPTGAYRGVGQPLACTITEQLVDLGAAALQIDPAELRRRNYRRTGPGIGKTINGIVIEELSLDVCLSTILKRMNYGELREHQQALRKIGVFRGIGLSTFVEITGVGSALYGSQGLRVAANENCRLMLDGSGRVRCETSITDQGQGTSTGIAQIVADELGVPIDAVKVVTGDTAIVPYGGGAWASRGITLGGEAARRAARSLRENALEIAASLLQQPASVLSVRDGSVVNAAGAEQISLAEIAAATRYRPHTIPLDEIPPLEVVASYVPQSVPYVVANGVQAASVEVDRDTGVVKLLDFWIAEDCGRVINPLLVDEQLRGGAVQGIGAAMYEHCAYSAEGQLLNGSLADYLVPMASDMPDIDIAHAATPTRTTVLGAKGVGEAGTVGAPGAIWTAVNDALRPLGIQVKQQPITPDHIAGLLTKNN
jgi:CO/xanthine dehydrogenase Mo-binding subunit/aerobic-type carbon monoxide dehydrogenase small subunit (CoxS/CutS family)